MKRFNETYGKRKFLSRNEWADTYKAIHSGNEDIVLVKLLVNKSNDEEYINNLSNEIKIIKSIKNPNLININDMFQYSACGKSYYYIESEYFKGISLEKKIESEQIDEKEAVKIVEEISKALKSFHLKKLSFNSLSLKDIIINNENKIKVDTLSYLENKEFVKVQEDSDEEVVEVFDFKKDIYNIGVILYILLSQKTTFEEKTYKKDIKNKELLYVIEKATDKNNSQKYDDLKMLIEDLESYLLHGEIKKEVVKKDEKVVVAHKPKKTKKEKTKEVNNKEVKNKDKKVEEKKEDLNKENKKGKFGKAMGICAALSIVAGSGVYAYDYMDKNHLDMEKIFAKIEEKFKKDDEEVKEASTKVEHNKVENTLEENKKEETQKEEENKKPIEETDSSKDNNKNSLSSSTSKKNKNNKPNKNSSKPNKENKSTSNKLNKKPSTTNKPNNTTTNKPSNNTNKPNNNTTNKPSNNTNKPNNNTTNKPSNNTNKPNNNTINKPSNNTNKPNNNTTNKPSNNTNKPDNNTTNKPSNKPSNEQTDKPVNKPEESKPEVTPTPDDSNNTGSENTGSNDVLTENE